MKPNTHVRPLPGRTPLYLMLLLMAFLFVLSSSAAADDQLLDESYSTEPVVLSKTLSEDGSITAFEVMFPVVADTFITSGLPDNNWGGDPNLRAGFNVNNGWGAERMLMRFDFSIIPANAVINSATFQILMTESNPANDPPLGFEARFLNSSWNEFQVTWNSHQPDWGSVFTTGSSNNVLGWKSVEATALVREWVNGSRVNHGLIVIANETPAQHERVFRSKEVGDGNFPRMIVNYDISTDVTPPTSSVNPLPTFSMDSFVVSWTGQDNPGGSGISRYDVMFQINGGSWINWLLSTQDTQATFAGGANGTTYGFRVRAIDNAGNVQPWSPTAQASTTVDTIPPNATISPLLPQFTCDPSFTISWVGSDNGGGSGLRTSPGPFDLQYQINGGDWQFWLVGTAQTSVQATGAVDGETYGFRVRATDQAGNVQPWSSTAQSTTTASFGEVRAQVNQFQPFHTSANLFSVSWAGAANNCATLASFDVRYRIGTGSWTTWRTGTTAISDIFDVSSLPDGTYTFQARARDADGNVGPWSEDLGEAFIFVFRDPAFPALPLYLPLTFR